MSKGLASYHGPISGLADYLEFVQAVKDIDPLKIVESKPGVYIYFKRGKAS